MIEGLATITSSNGCKLASTVPLLVDEWWMMADATESKNLIIETMPELDISVEWFTVASRTVDPSR